MSKLLRFFLVVKVTISAYSYAGKSDAGVDGDAGTSMY